ncbi:hypothetical protein YW7DRAFT_06575 [Streptomyces sp. AmelKG-E11A]|nr:hypothetical protein YW7DRAFT_06575 [Streptomyces sp. AmelKG-E11A]
MGHAGNDRFDAAIPQQPTVLVEVVAAVGEQLPGAVARSAGGPRMRGIASSRGSTPSRKPAARDGNWQDDVVVSSSDRSVRIAWEAQVSAITTQEITERTVRFAKDGDPFPRPGETEEQTRPHPDQRPLTSGGCPATHPCRGD